MKLIVGLGNPGEEYQQTRHNLGYIAVEKFIQDFEPVEKTIVTHNEKLKSNMLDFLWTPKEGTQERVIVILPQTYMNNSGQAVQLVAHYYKIEPRDIWIVHDELDLPLGSMRIRFGGAAAGHHGVESVINALGTDKFWRFRLGIGIDRNHEEVARHEMRDAEAYVLGKFNHQDAGKLRELVKHAAKALETALEKDMDTAMNRFNTK